MSDAVTLSLIAAVASTISGVLSFLNNQAAREHSIRLQNTEHAIVTLEKNTNSIKDELVKATKEASFARGLKAGLEGQSNPGELPPLPSSGA